MTYTPPTPDEIKRVGEYWRRVEHIACTHPTMTFQTSTDGPTCGECGRAVKILSDIQMEQMRKAPEDPTVRERLIAQMDRGGVTFEVDGQWREVRFHAHTEKGYIDDECICVPVKDVALLLRATDVR